MRLRTSPQPSPTPTFQHPRPQHTCHTCSTLAYIAPASTRSSITPFNLDIYEPLCVLCIPFRPSPAFFCLPFPRSCTPFCKFTGRTLTGRTHSHGLSALRQQLVSNRILTARNNLNNKDLNLCPPHPRPHHLHYPCRRQGLHQTATTPPGGPGCGPPQPRLEGGGVGHGRLVLPDCSIHHTINSLLLGPGWPATP